ncbi:MAG TPA: AMP-binding protein [Baekduia sp.]|jgi:acyl-CoA synthetase (AMP-forming)/AMP-acid ligase II
MHPWNVLGDALAARAREDGDRLAYDDGSEAITFAQLAGRAARRAGALRSMGVGVGDRVALVLPAGVPFAELFWAVQQLGAVSCAFNPATGAEALERRIAAITPRLIVDEALLAAWPDDAPAVPACAEIGTEDLAFIQPTSGTSGEPRGACVRHRNALAFLHAAGERGQVVHGDVMVAWVPPWHDFGLVRFVIGAVYHGASCHIVPPAIATIPRWLQTISRVGATVSGAPDFCFRLAARMVDPATVDLRSLRNMTNGGEPVRWSSIEAFESRFGVPGVVLPGYGLAECALGVAGTEPGEARAVDARGNVSHGLPLPGLEVRAGVGVEEPGEILVRGDAVFAGYLDAPEDTAARLQDGWLHTGDSGYVDAGGRLYVLGRRQGMIKRGGAMIAPRELEEAAQGVDAVRVAAALAIADSIVVVVEADEADAVAAAVTRQVVAACGFAPDRVLVTGRGTIPRTENGKIRHARLAAFVVAAPI